MLENGMVSGAASCGRERREPGVPRCARCGEPAFDRVEIGGRTLCTDCEYAWVAEHSGGLRLPFVRRHLPEAAGDWFGLWLTGQEREGLLQEAFSRFLGGAGPGGEPGEFVREFCEGHPEFTDFAKGELG